MVAHSTEISVPARLTELPCLLAAVDAWAAIVGIPPIAVQRIHFAVEELCTNTVDHAFRAESDLTVTMALAADG
ncbi:MAG: ATP-binding protein, partial [Betaproteobacteria bacterium]|nr:ATP-binding protein [Betaproteobacteria bacterium]